MDIYRYKKDSITGYEVVTVDDDYQLQPGELRELPTPCYTPMKLDVSGNLVSATLEESNAFYGVTEYEAKPSATQQQLAMMNMQIAQLTQNNAALTKLIMAQNTQISKLKGAN